MFSIEGPDRGQRHASISTHRQRRQGARHALPTRRICRNRRGRFKSTAKFGRRRARVNPFEYFFRHQHENGAGHRGRTQRSCHFVARIYFSTAFHIVVSPFCKQNTPEKSFCFLFRSMLLIYFKFRIYISNNYIRFLY